MGKTDDQYECDIALYKCISRFFIEHQNAKFWFREKHERLIFDTWEIMQPFHQTFCTRNIWKIVEVITQGKCDWGFVNMGDSYVIVSTNPKRPAFEIILNLI